MRRGWWGRGRSRGDGGEGGFGMRRCMNGLLRGCRVRKGSPFLDLPRRVITSFR